MAKVKQFGGAKTALPVLKDLVQRAHYSDLRIGVVDALGQFHSEEAEKALISILKQDRDWHVRNAAVKNLARLATPKTLAALKQTTKDKAYGVRKDARVLLEQ